MITALDMCATPEIFGDVVLGRKDVPTSYHLACTWDDALQDGRAAAARVAGADLALRLAETLRVAHLLRHRDGRRVAREDRDLRRAQQVGALLLRQRADHGVDVEFADHARDRCQRSRQRREIRRARDLRRRVDDRDVQLRRAGDGAVRRRHRGFRPDNSALLAAGAAGKRVGERAIIRRINRLRPGVDLGTARMGRDPKTSVLNSFNQAHDVQNLFITDGGAMVSSSCVNPSLSIWPLPRGLAIMRCGK